jgi:hypothetical protein
VREVFRKVTANFYASMSNSLLTLQVVTLQTKETPPSLSYHFPSPSERSDGFLFDRLLHEQKKSHEFYRRIGILLEQSYEMKV